MKSSISRLSTSLVLLLVSTVSLAQDGKLIDVDIDLGREEWYESPWVLAAAVVLLIIVFLLLRRGGKR